MIKQRLLTAFILLMLLALSFLFLPLWALKILFLITLIAALWEWCAFIPLKHPRSQLIYLASCILIAWIASYIPILWILWIGVLGWTATLPLLIHFQHAPHTRYPAWGNQLLGSISFLCCCLSGIFLLNQGRMFLAGTWIGVVLVDSAAYLFGQLFGRHALCRHISPNKTLEGLLGGLLGLVATTEALRYVSPPHLQLSLPPYWVMLSMGIACVLGDLFISMLKRQHNMKDTGQLLPGHGGILDRIDSFLAAVPLIALWVAVTIT